MSRGCDYLISHSCPLTKGDIVTWAFDWDFLPDEIFPAEGDEVNFRAEIILYDKNVDIMTCFRVNLATVK